MPVEAQNVPTDSTAARFDTAFPYGIDGKRFPDAQQDGSGGAHFQSINAAWGPRTGQSTLSQPLSETALNRKESFDDPSATKALDASDPHFQTINEAWAPQAVSRR
jgi:hypothetical protein